jgi:phosphomannomutase
LRSREFFRQRYPIIDVDGVRIQFPEGWGLIRASNTQPALVLRFEAQTPEKLREYRDTVEAKLKEFRSD